jgi:hypothetical protein
VCVEARAGLTGHPNPIRVERPVAPASRRINKARRQLHPIAVQFAKRIHPGHRYLDRLQGILVAIYRAMASSSVKTSPDIRPQLKQV